MMNMTPVVDMRDAALSKLPEALSEEQRREAERAIGLRMIGAQRVMFGSDYPWFDPIQGVQRLLKLDLTEEEKRLIFSENAIRIYEI